MKYAMIAIAIALVVAGCANSAPQAEPSPSAQPTPAAADNLGSKQSAGSYDVVLRSKGSPKAAKLSLEAEVSQSGKPVPNADVSVDLTMPEMKEMGASVIHLKPVGAGRYAGDGDLAMPGGWDAVLTVKGPDGKPAGATYHLTAQ